jgi:hypothetical protein
MNSPQIGKGVTFNTPTTVTLVPISSWTMNSTDLTPVMTGYTGNGFTIAASSDYPGTYPAWYPFDANTTSTYWASQVGDPGTLYIDCGNTLTIGGYSITNSTAYDGSAGRCPVNFTFQGSSDGSNYTILDTRTGITWPAANTVRTFTLSSIANYRYYKFVCTSLNGDSYIQLHNFELYGATSSSGYQRIETGFPSNPKQFDTWFNPTDGYTRIYNGLSWKYLIGPNGSTTIGEGFSFGGVTAAGVKTSNIDKVAFPFDSGTANSTGNMTQSNTTPSGVNSSLYGYLYIADNGTLATTSIDKLTFASQGNSYTNVGCLAIGRIYTKAFNSSTAGYNCGGANYVGTAISSVDKLIFSTDSTNSAIVANIAGSRGRFTSPCNCSLYGFIGGNTAGGGALDASIIDKMTFSADTSMTATGQLAYVRGQGTSGLNSSIHGYFGGYISGYITLLDRIAFPWAGGTASAVGGITNNPYACGGCGSTTYGYVCGGVTSTVSVAASHVNRFGFPFDSGSASMIGYISAGKNSNEAIDSTDFIKQFI